MSISPISSIKPVTYAGNLAFNGTKKAEEQNNEAFYKKAAANLAKVPLLTMIAMSPLNMPAENVQRTEEPKNRTEMVTAPQAQNDDDDGYYKRIYSEEVAVSKNESCFYSFVDTDHNTNDAEMLIIDYSYHRPNGTKEHIFGEAALIFNKPNSDGTYTMAFTPMIGKDYGNVIYCKVPKLMGEHINGFLQLGVFSEKATLLKIPKDIIERLQKDPSMVPDVKYIRQLCPEVVDKDGNVIRKINGR